jgi:hypothetical protein
LRRRRAGSPSAAAVACVAGLALAGCGGGGGGGGSSSSSHTYVVQAAANKNPLAKGIYITIVSPVPIPTKLLTGAGGKLVGRAQGPQKCSFDKTVHGSQGSGAFLSGKTLTIKLTGTSPFIPAACKALEKAPLNAAHLGGT